MQSSLTYKVYNNIIAMLAYRKLELVNGNATNLGKAIEGIPDETQFSSIIQLHDYITIKARDSEDKIRTFPEPLTEGSHRTTTTIVILVNDTNYYIQNSELFKKLLNTVPTNSDNIDVIIVTKAEPKSSIIKTLQKYLRLPDSSTGYIRFQLYNYYYFSSLRMASKNISPARILPKQEAKGLLKDARTKINSIAKIYGNDMVAVWLGAEKGEVILDEIPCESAGISLRYSLVLANPSAYPS